MARRSPQTAAKRAREQARRERRERKEAKKAARKATGTDDAAWQIFTSAPISPPRGGRLGAAFLVTLASGSATREVVVEFASPSTGGSSTAAEEVATRFVRDEEPPGHLLVEPWGAVNIVTELVK